MRSGTNFIKLQLAQVADTTETPFMRAKFAEAIAYNVLNQNLQNEFLSILWRNWSTITNDDLYREHLPEIISRISIQDSNFLDLLIKSVPDTTILFTNYEHLLKCLDLTEVREALVRNLGDNYIAALPIQAAKFFEQKNILKDRQQCYLIGSELSSQLEWLRSGGTNSYLNEIAMPSEPLTHVIEAKGQHQRLVGGVTLDSIIDQIYRLFNNPHLSDVTIELLTNGFLRGEFPSLLGPFLKDKFGEYQLVVSLITNELRSQLKQAQSAVEINRVLQNYEDWHLVPATIQPYVYVRLLAALHFERQLLELS